MQDAILFLLLFLMLLTLALTGIFYVDGGFTPIVQRLCVVVTVIGVIGYICANVITLEK